MKKSRPYYFGPVMSGMSLIGHLFGNPMIRFHGRNQVIAKPLPKPTPVTVGAMLGKCPGGRHAWFNSNVGVIRKPIDLCKNS